MFDERPHGIKEPEKDQGALKAQEDKTKEGFASIELQKLDMVKRILAILDELGDSDANGRLSKHKHSVLMAVSALS